ncbi:MAG: hypothetical protein BGO63_07730 [Candidatus Accumulibacter sp. 66-26]|nr:LapA family protein [Accumulibacter sp.]OJW46595.1 MAG: hypothetical protein BGO63_07730 [Candidatus Accumulibacter sp. 66-26]
MQLMLILGIGFAIGAVALQNNVPVTVSFIVWSFEGSLAMVLLLALGLGALIAGLVSSPAMIRRQWTGTRLRRQVDGLEAEKSALERRVGELEREVAALAPTPAEAAVPERPYVGLTTLLGSDAEQRDREG